MLTPNPFLGVFFHWLGGFAAASFYVAYKAVRYWSWETYWLVGGFFSWLVLPAMLALLLTKDFAGVLGHQSLSTLGWTYGFGVLWGFGGLTFGLTMRYLGLSLGTGIALGYCAVFGTLLPPIFKQFFPRVPAGESIVQIAVTLPGQITLAGVAICVLGIVIAAGAGLAKERAMPAAEKAKAIAEFSFAKGLVVATFCGIMSATFAFGLTAGNPIAESSLAAGTDRIWSGLPKLVLVLLGGLTTNLSWCLTLSVRRGSWREYAGRYVRPDGRGHAAVLLAVRERRPLLRNYLYCALAGAMCYLQFVFYTMGESQMGRFNFASWTLHMASIIIFATLWGWIYHEWRGSGRKAHKLIAFGLATLILSTVVIGLGTFLKVNGGR